MDRVAEIYTTSVHHHLKPLYANWEPARPLKLGDYGTLSKGSFNYFGNIADMGVEFEVRRSSDTHRRSFASAGSTTVKLHAKGSAEYVRAALEIRFSAADAVFFNATNCRYSMIADKVALGRRILELLRDKAWERRWAVITDMIHSEATTVAVSGSDSASLVLEAAEDLPVIDLADASVKLTVGSEERVGYHLIGEKGLTPLLGLSAIQRALLRPTGTLEPLGRKSETRPSDEPLFFGELVEPLELA